MRVTILNQFYLPDISPTAQLAGSLAEHRAALGDTVTVIASDQKYVAVASSDKTGRRDRRVRVEGIPTPGFGKKVTVLRALDYLSFFVLAALRVVTLPKQDVVITMTTPPYVILVGLLHKFLHRSKLILWVMDCYPEVPEMAGMLKKGSIPSRILRALNRFVFKRVDHVVTLDGAMTQLLLSQYQVRPGKPPATVIPNWERADLFPAGAVHPKWEGVEKYNLAGKFVVLYLGNAGAGHEFDTLISVAEQLKDEPVVFLFIGGGSRWKELTKAKEEKGLSNLLLMGYVPKDQTGSVMAACDMALITLRDLAVGLISPSKLHSNLALGLPVLYVGPQGSNVDEAIARHDVGVSVRIGDAAGAVAFVRRLRSDPALLAEYKNRARAAFDGFYNDAKTLPQFDRIIDAGKK